MEKPPQSSRRRLTDLAAFATVAEAQSFTRAAARLGVTQSALSHQIKQLEAELGVRLLSRTTRSVTATVAGEALLQRLNPALADIEQALAAVGHLSRLPQGRLRITTFKLAASVVLWPMLPGFLKAHPGIDVEVHVSDRLTNIVTERFDAGIRFRGAVERDMVGVPVGPPLRFITVAAPAYLQRHGTPKKPADLLAHRCLRYRLSSSGELDPWRYRQGARAQSVKVHGPLVSNDNDTLLQAALDGLGVAQVVDRLALAQLASGQLVELLAAKSPVWYQLMLYHPSRRHMTAALQALIAALRPPPAEAR